MLTLRPKLPQNLRQIRLLRLPLGLTLSLTLRMRILLRRLLLLLTRPECGIDIRTCWKLLRSRRLLRLWVLLLVVLPVLLLLLVVVVGRLLVLSG